MEYYPTHNGENELIPPNNLRLVRNNYGITELLTKSSDLIIKDIEHRKFINTHGIHNIE
jgi:hypothetical protein